MSNNKGRFQRGRIWSDPTKKSDGRSFSECPVHQIEVGPDFLGGRSDLGRTFDDHFDRFTTSFSPRLSAPAADAHSACKILKYRRLLSLFIFLSKTPLSSATGTVPVHYITRIVLVLHVLVSYRIVLLYMYSYRYRSTWYETPNLFISGAATTLFLARRQRTFLFLA